MARDFAPAIAARDPAFLEKMEGIAEGSGIDLETVIVVTARIKIFNGRA